MNEEKKEALYHIDKEKTINCPQCGDLIDVHFKWTRLIVCNSCKSTLFLNPKGNILRLGDFSELSPEPSLVKLHEAIKIDNQVYLPLGKIRYSYGRGFWEEWFLKGAKNREFWLSIDEGDFVLQQRIKMSLPFKNPREVVVGKEYSRYIATEKGWGKCVGFEGELPERIKLDAVHYYIHLSRGEGKLLTVEYENEQVTESYTGQWIVPFSIEKV